MKTNLPFAASLLAILASAGQAEESSPSSRNSSGGSWLPA